MADFTMEEIKETKLSEKPRPLSQKLLIILITVLTAAVASILAGVFSGLAAGAQTGTINPLITLNYIILSYLLGYFYELTKKQQYSLCLFGLILSFIFSFGPGILTLIFILPILKRLKLV